MDVTLTCTFDRTPPIYSLKFKSLLANHRPFWPVCAQCVGVCVCVCESVCGRMHVGGVMSANV